jgi:hypothetical protein
LFSNNSRTCIGFELLSSNSKNFFSFSARSILFKAGNVLKYRNENYKGEKTDNSPEFYSRDRINIYYRVEGKKLQGRRQGKCKNACVMRATYKRKCEKYAV